MTAIRYIADEPGRIYRKVTYGPLLDVFFVDLRSYRGLNSHGVDTNPSDGSLLLGERQLAWLKRELVRSTATWKVIACDLPIGLVIWDDYGHRRGSESISNGDNSAPLGRELEFADLLRFVRDAGISNMVWLTADVHYTAAHYYDPGKAKSPRVPPILGICGWTSPFRNLRPATTRHDLRAAGEVHEGSTRRRGSRTCRHRPACNFSG